MWQIAALFQGQQPYGSQQPFVSSQQASPVVEPTPWAFGGKVLEADFFLKLI